ncbi:MAG: DUF4388 domain-containing protein [Nitrospirota bacterium]|nr:MAG: DUF4388 domain-containing protein [Nitrospirota bacterium]
MGLEGSIEDFGLADILQLLYFQKKSGLLTVEGRLGRVKIYFNQGNIVAAESKKKLEDKRLGKILVRKELITEEKLQEVLDQKKSSTQKLGSLLIKNGLVEKESIKDIIVNQLTEVVVSLFNWKQGTYEFKPQGVSIDKDLGIAVDTQHLLMDGLRIVDELSVIEGKVTLDTVFKKVKKKGLALSDAEENILSNIDGENDVSSIIEMSELDELDVSKTLVSLIEKGAIEEFEQKEYVTVSTGRERGRINILGFLSYLVLLASLAISVNPLLLKKDGADMVKAGRDINGITMSLETGMFLSGRYPVSLSAIKAPQKDPWGNDYIYKVTPDGFYLRSSGPDGKPQTPDDIF